MTWLHVATIQTSTSYQLTNVVEGSLFRIINISSSTNTSKLLLRIGQAFGSEEDLQLFDIRKITYKVVNELFLFTKPQGLTDRKIFVKRDDFLSVDWTIEIQVLEETQENDMATLTTLITNLTNVLLSSSVPGSISQANISVQFNSPQNSFAIGMI